VKKAVVQATGYGRVTMTSAGAWNLRERGKANTERAGSRRRAVQPRDRAAI